MQYHGSVKNVVTRKITVIIRRVVLNVVKNTQTAKKPKYKRVRSILCLKDHPTNYKNYRIQKEIIERRVIRKAGETNPI